MKSIFPSLTILLIGGTLFAQTTVIDETTFNASDWNYATGLNSPSITGGGTLVFDQGDTDGGTINDSAYLFRNFSSAASLGIGETIRLSTDISFANGGIDRGEFGIAFLAQNTAASVSGNQTVSAAWEQAYATALAIVPGTSTGLVANLPGSEDFAKGGSSEDPGSVLFKSPLELKGQTGEKPETGDFVPGAVLNTSITNSLVFSLTRNSNTQITLDVLINGDSIGFPFAGTLTGTAWTSDTWDDVTGIALGFDDTFASDDNRTITLDNLNVSVIPEPSSLLLILVSGIAGLTIFRRRLFGASR